MKLKSRFNYKISKPASNPAAHAHDQKRSSDSMTTPEAIAYYERQLKSCTIRSKCLTDPADRAKNEETRKHAKNTLTFLRECCSHYCVR